MRLLLDGAMLNHRNGMHKSTIDPLPFASI